LKFTTLTLALVPFLVFYYIILTFINCFLCYSGLYARFTNDVGRAISEFNLARKDETWGPVALTHMVELYLNPDQEGVWEEKEAVRMK